MNTLHVIRFFVPGSLENYNHLLLCKDTQSAAVVDPFDPDQVDGQLQQAQAKLDKILVTHEHGDHIRGVAELAKRHQVPVYGPKGLAENIIAEGDQVSIGQGQVTCWFTPGHTMKHFCFFGQGPERPFLICADTLFNAGVGNTYSGDTPTLYRTIEDLKTKVPGDTEIYPAHDYITTNLKFAADREPENSVITDWLAQVTDQDAHTRAITTFADELTFNPFLRLEAPGIRGQLQSAGIGPDSTNEAVFTALRNLRNQW